MNLLIVAIVLVFLSALGDRPGPPVRVVPLVVMAAVLATAYLSQRVI